MRKNIICLELNFNGIFYFYHLWLCKIFYNYEDLWDLPVEHFNVPVHEFFAMKSNTQRPQL